GRDLVEPVAVVAADVVDQHVEVAAERLGGPGDRLLQGRHVGDVAGAEPGPRRARCLDRAHQFLAARGGDVDERDPRALARERLHQRGADAAAAAGDENAAPGQARVGRLFADAAGFVRGVGYRHASGVLRGCRGKERTGAGSRTSDYAGTP